MTENLHAQQRHFVTLAVGQMVRIEHSPLDGLVGKVNALDGDRVLVELQKGIYAKVGQEHVRLED